VIIKTLKDPKKPGLQKIKTTDLPKLSILVIDDNSDLLDLQKTILGMEGFEVFTAQSGREAIQVLAEIEEPDLILLDMQLQDMTGSTFLLVLEKKMSRVLKNVPVVFHSAMDQVPMGKAVGFIRKNAKIDEFLCSVHRFMKVRQSVHYQH